MSSTVSYDDFGRLIEINWKEKYANSVQQHLTYDLAGNVSHMAREHPTYDLSYDPADQLMKSLFKGLRGAPGYNREFRRAKVVDPLGQPGYQRPWPNLLPQNGSLSLRRRSLR